ncbi:MAG: hypothetical protein WBZ36_18945 [Candidatus Nitrosopolaris sp.]|jgi:hypothetical protein
MANEITEELRSFREQGVVIFDRRKLHINIIGKDQKGKKGYDNATMLIYPRQH